MAVLRHDPFGVVSIAIWSGKLSGKLRIVPDIPRCGFLSEVSMFATL